MVTFIYRLLVAGILASVGFALCGCVVAKLTVGFTVAPPGGYLAVAGFDDTAPPPPPATAPADGLPGQTQPAVTPTPAGVSP